VGVDSGSISADPVVGPDSGKQAVNLRCAAADLGGVWTLARAWPTKITGTELASTGNEVTVETIVIAHEGLTIATA
jgi:phage tail-like protein